MPVIDTWLVSAVLVDNTRVDSVLVDCTWLSFVLTVDNRLVFAPVDVVDSGFAVG